MKAFTYAFGGVTAIVVAFTNKEMIFLGIAYLLLVMAVAELCDSIRK